MKKGKVLSSIAFAVTCLFTFVVVGIAATQVTDEITIKASLWPTPTKAPVPFSHKKHSSDYKIACAECHHKFEGGKNVWKEGDAVEKCEVCHNEPTVQGEKKLTPEQQKLNLKLAFHGNCQGCHQKIKKDKPDTTAPITCTGCHPAQK